MFTNMLKTFGVAALLILVSTAAFAQSGSTESAFEIIVSKGSDLFEEIRTVVFVLGGFGLVGLAVASIFGRPMWKWFGALALGLVVIAVAGALVNYFVSKDGQKIEGESVDFNDTMFQ